MAESALPDVVPADRCEFIRSAYLEQVRGIVPDVLVGRSAELNEWEEFCAGAAPYSWWQAGLGLSTTLLLKADRAWHGGRSSRCS
jgi:hypothetical protein